MSFNKAKIYRDLPGYWANKYVRNCDKCDLDSACQNTAEKLCVMELRPGDIINFTDTKNQVRRGGYIVEDRDWKGNLELTTVSSKKIGCRVDSIFITAIEKTGYRQGYPSGIYDGIATDK